MIETIQEDFGFDCKCPVCSGEVPNQDDIMLETCDIVSSYDGEDKRDDEMTRLDWTRQALTYKVIVELAKPVYMGREEAKMNNFWILWRAATESRNPALLQKAFDGMKELAEKTGLEIFKKPIDEIEKIIEERK